MELQFSFFGSVCFYRTWQRGMKSLIQSRIIKKAFLCQQAPIESGRCSGEFMHSFSGGISLVQWICYFQWKALSYSTDTWDVCLMGKQKWTNHYFCLAPQPNEHRFGSLVQPEAGARWSRYSCWRRDEGRRTFQMKTTHGAPMSIARQSVARQACCFSKYKSFWSLWYLHSSLLE